MPTCLKTGDSVGASLKVALSATSRWATCFFSSSKHLGVNCSDRANAERCLKEIVAQYAPSAPKLAAWMEEHPPKASPSLRRPQPINVTFNALERVNMELKRRTRVASLFPNEVSLLRLVSGLLAEFSDEWETGRVYPDMKCQTRPFV